MKKSDIAAENFKGKCNCCQSVFLAFCEDLGMGKEEAFKVAAGFGGGMGRLQEVCGALSGAFMALGLKFSHDKALCYQKVREMGERFKAENGHLTCRGLLGHDFLTEEAAAKAVAKEKCPALVRSSAEILETVL